MASLTAEEKKLIEVTEDHKEMKKEIKEPFFLHWNKKEYLKSFTPHGYPDGKGLKTKDGLKEKKLPLWKMSLYKMKWYMPLLFLILGALIVFFVFIAKVSGGTSRIKEILNFITDETSGETIWYGWFSVLSIVLFTESLWFGFYFGFQLVFYPSYKKKVVKKKTAVQIQSENVEQNRKKYGTYSFKDLLPNLGPKKMFNVTILDDATTLHDNMGWVVKTGITNNPVEISLLKKGLISKRMWEERPNETILPYIDNWGKNGKVPDKEYVYYVVSNSIDKLHCFSEGDTGSGKTEAYASPESIFALRHVSRPSVLFTCKSGDQHATINQAKCLDIKVQHIDLGAPAKSASFNPLYLPYIYHKLKRQLKYTHHPIPMNLTPWDWENQYDVEIRQKDNKSIVYLEDISTKEQLLEKLSSFTNNKTVTDLLPNWQDEKITLQDAVKVYKSWEDKKWMVVDIKKHFLFSDRLSYWNENKKKTTTLWYRCGNWIFESIDEFNTKKDKLYSMVESEFLSSVESVITNVMNEEKNVSQDAFWNNQVRLFLKMFVGTFFDLVELGDFTNNKITMSDAFFNLPTLCAWLNNYCESAKKMGSLADNYAQVIPTIEKYKSNMKFPDQTFQSITGSVNAITQYYSAQSELLPVITRNDFNPLDFGLEQMLLCITTNNNEDAKANVLLKDVAGQVLNACNFITNNYSDASGKSCMPRPVRVILDEAGSGAPVPWASVNAIATKGRSQKILEGLYYQTTKQIQTQYPKIAGAEEILFGNLALKRCIKASAEDSLKKWSSILGKGFATTLSDEDKKAELAGASEENPYFPAEYIRNKPMWNSLIKIGEMKTIDVSSCPLFPTSFKEKLQIEAKKHETKEYKQRVTSSTNFWDNNYVNLAEVLSYLDKKLTENYNFAVLFNELESTVTYDEDGEANPVNLPFYIRFSPKSYLQNYTSSLDNFAEWEKKQQEEDQFSSSDLSPDDFNN